ncbi:multiple epidermal growth factor-like domains protein 8 [Manacus candei]|uniref:multiple epidermal growth factor-like domains protein 8 n=1 Tax=Manacus candei TaxID=415023 RepID=UPI002227B236|nr:multiple epidermal growth factor-like domains protein 8 [Manacus candei]
MPVESAPPLPCPAPCHLHRTCPACLRSPGADGGWQHCEWSVHLGQCLSPSWVPLRCLAGGCGRLIRGGVPGGGGGGEGGSELCPSPQECSGAPQCSQCLRRPRCGWCARRGHNGGGTCLQGGLGGPQEGVSEPCEGGLWSYLSCPPEDECANGHHTCAESQVCRDLPRGFTCTCRHGYTPDSSTGECRPVCAQGCANGTCVAPDTCRCHFGFVGPACATPCACNGHSDCAGPAQRHTCLRCHNNTQGPQCERCRPLFVGSALGGGTCRPCSSFCRHHAQVCLGRGDLERARRDPRRYPLEPHLIHTWLTEGPSEADAVCVGCGNNSLGDRCDTCRPGFFLLDGTCTRCQCNGHADTCNELDGTGCPCQNNTESGTCPDRRDCYRHQCSKCRDSFQGHPVGGQQCYRLLAVEQEYCLDPWSQSHCFPPPQRRPLPAGRAVLFAVQPKFTNVDIRVTLDVTFGAVDLFVATSYDTFAVDVEPGTGRHLVRVQGAGAAGGGPTGAADTGPTGATGGPGAPEEPALREERAQGLVTYLTVREPVPALVVRGVRDRLVLTYPHARHPLKSTRFYLLVLGGPGPSQGLLFFRQDQAHIDLFVFFSVFFSCFFLFLALCVLLWKAKQGLDARHERRRHRQEMSKMAARPFARVTVCFEPREPRPGGHRRGRGGHQGWPSQRLANRKAEGGDRQNPPLESQNLPLEGPKNPPGHQEGRLGHQEGRFGHQGWPSQRLANRKAEGGEQPDVQSLRVEPQNLPLETQNLPLEGPKNPLGHQEGRLGHQGWPSQRLANQKAEGGEQGEGRDPQNPPLETQNLPLEGPKNPPGHQETPLGHQKGWLGNQRVQDAPNPLPEAQNPLPDPQKSPRDPQNLHLGTPRDPRDPQTHPRDPQKSPRDPQNPLLATPRDPRDPQNPLLDPQNLHLGTLRDPRDPQTHPRDPQNPLLATPRDPRDPQNPPRDPQPHPRDPQPHLPRPPPPPWDPLLNPPFPSRPPPKPLFPSPPPLAMPGAGPVTLEPTEDGVAAVATLLLQLPGGPGGPPRAALASALVTLRQGLHEFGGGAAGGASGGVPPARKGGLVGHELTSMAL